MDYEGKKMEVDESEVETEEETELPSTSTTTPRKRIEISKFHAVALWTWDIVVDNCAICRNHIMEPCIECQGKPAEPDIPPCTAAWGKCNHAFHFHCISRWLNTRRVCPLDNGLWEYKKYGN